MHRGFWKAAYIPIAESKERLWERENPKLRWKKKISRYENNAWKYGMQVWISWNTPVILAYTQKK